MASAGWDDVLGGGGAGDEPPGPEGGGDGGDAADDAPPARKKRVKTSTKVVLVVAGWLLLTLFLVGQFSSDRAQPSAVARLDTVSGGDGVAGEDDEVFEPEPVDTEEEELLDVDGDGFLSAAEQGVIEGEAAASAEGGSGGSGSGSASSGVFEGTAGETPTGANAVPGAAPGSGGSGSGGSSGGSTGSTSTPAGGGGSAGGSGSSTTTTATKSGGGPATTTTTTANTSTTTGGGGQPPPPGPEAPSSASATWNGNTEGFDPTSVTIRLNNGLARVTITNDTNFDRNFRVNGGAWREIKKHNGTRTFDFDAAGVSEVAVENSSKTLTITVLG